jgi:UDP-N-acetylglucosamine 3-dehydrogenase
VRDVGVIKDLATHDIDVVTWLSDPRIVLGEGGMLEADTLTGDLFFYENAEVDIAWSTTQQFRGVGEGNVTRYALKRDEPLRVELDTFIEFVAGAADADGVGLERGVEIVRIAETVIESARSGRTLTSAVIS